ncbi:MAG: hypothetical protein JWM82_3970, partial [Myxococcales bacterium]|nr:hypothetical protein [Myxococcales bacterium]
MGGVCACASLAAGRGALGQDDVVDVPVGPLPLATQPGAKPVDFDKTWLEPYFTKGPAKDGLDRFREEDWAGADAGFGKAVRALKKGSDELLAARYMLALSRENASKWKEAGDAFEALYDAAPKLATYHAYHAARCRLRGGDAAGALAWADKVTAGTVPEAETTLIRIDAFRALARWDEAKAAIEAFLARFPNGPRRAEALFKRGEAMEKLAAGKPSDANAALLDVTAVYRRVWSEAPLEPWADRAAERLEALATTRPKDEARLVRTHGAGE